jgi:hypothetical protein
MAEIRVVTALISKRAELAGLLIEHLQKEMGVWRVIWPALTPPSSCYPIFLS